MAGIPGQPSPKPSSLPPQTPGQAAAQQPAPNIPSGGAGFDALDSMSGGGGAAPQPSGGFGALDAMGSGSGSQAALPPEETPGLAHQALDAAGRVLDYPGGLIRTGVGEVAGLATGQPNTVGPEDVKNALKGKAPASAELLRRLGVSEGGSLTLPGFGRVTTRGAEGLALDVLSDPLTLIAKTVKGAPYIAKLLEQPGRASEAMGEAIYKSAIRGKDAESAAQAGDMLLQAGAPVGGQQKLVESLTSAADTMGKMRQGLYDKFTEAGGKIDVTDATFKNAQGVLKNLRMNPTMRGLADEFEQMLNQYKGEGFVPMDVMSKWKTQLYDSLPKSAFNGATLSNPAKMFKAALAQDFKTAIIDNGNKIEKGLGDAIDHVNDKWGALLDVTPDMGKGLKPGSLGQAIDAAAYAFGGVTGLVKKKAFDLATGPYGRTVVGKALMLAGQHGVADKLANRAVIDSTQPEVPQE